MDSTGHVADALARMLNPADKRAPKSPSVHARLMISIASDLTRTERLSGFEPRDRCDRATASNEMDYERLWQIGERVRHGDRLPSGEKEFIARVVPHALAGFPRVTFPSRVRHPAGFVLSGAPVRTLARCVLLLSARRVLGARYEVRSEFYGRVAADLAFGIMRSHFHHGHPKGTYCCAACTLAVYPVLKANALRALDCRALARAVRQLVERRQWRFAGSRPAGLLAWALG